MKLRLKAVALAAAMIAARAVHADTPAKAADAAKKPAHAANTKADTAAKPAAQATDTDEKGMMEKWIQVATPGAGHRWLEPLVGAWDARITLWMAPGAPPQESTGTSENKWVLGGRYVEQRYEGTFMGQPFSGIGYTGYDNYKKKYVGTWMDTMGTMVMVSQGDVTGQSLSMTSTIDDIMAGKPANVKSEIKILGPDHLVMEMWGPDPSGKPFKTMEIHYTRKK